MAYFIKSYQVIISPHIYKTKQFAGCSRKINSYYTVFSIERANLGKLFRCVGVYTQSL